MSTRLGLDAALYRNSGTYSTPVLVKVGNCKDVTVNLEKNKADVTTRSNNGWRANIGVLKDASVDFAMVWNTSDENFQAIRDAFLHNTPIEFFVMSADVAETDSEGLRATFSIDKFTKNEPLEDAQGVDVSMSPTFADHAPDWVTGGPYSAFA